MNETHCRNHGAPPVTAFWSIELHTHCPSCYEDFDVIEAHPDFIAEQGVVRSGITQIECPECGNEFQIEMVF